MQTRNEVSDAKEAAITKKPNYLLLCSCWKAGARGSELVYIAELTKMVLDELPGDEYQRCLGRLLGVDEGNIRFKLEIANLPPEYKDAIREGESASSALKRAKQPASNPEVANGPILPPGQQFDKSQPGWPERLLQQVSEDTRRRTLEDMENDRLGARAFF